MNRSKIEWTNYSINPIKGLCPMACSYCYARRMYKRFKWNPEIRFEPIRNSDLPRKPSRIFVGSTMELFGEWIDTFWLDSIFKTVRNNPQHTFIFLTKCPQNLIKWEFPENCWVGVSVCNDKMLDVAVDKLEDLQAKHKFISFEPLLERLTLSLNYAFYYSGINWLIIGQQTPIRPETTPKLEWIKEIVEAADKASVLVFLKNNLAPLLIGKRSFKDADPLFIHKDGGWYTLRQEFPKA